MHADDLLGARYRFECQVFNKDLWYEDAVISYDDRPLPSINGGANDHLEHVVFEARRAMSDLREHVFTRDQLVAELTLTNLETGESQVRRSKVMTVDLTG